MLQSLSIANVVLIERLELTFEAGLGVLTGETGAGKSILLDALGLALGMRAETRLVRHGAKQAVVSATFDLKSDNSLDALLDEHGLAADEDLLILRRVLGADGRSRAFVNDQPVSVTLLKLLGETLVEVHGQFESQRLLSPANHRGLLDSYGGLKGVIGEVSNLWRQWRAAIEAHAQAENEMAAARRDQDFLVHAIGELGDLDPKAGEDQALAAKRTMMMHGEHLIDAMNKALGELNRSDGPEEGLRTVAHRLEQVADKANGRLDEAIATLDRAAIEAAEGQALLEKASSEIDLDPQKLEAVEERLFALRAQARKHNVEVDDLADLLARMQGQLAAVEDGGARLVQLKKAEQDARDAYETAARSLSKSRTKAADQIDKAVGQELAPLKMEKAVFVTCIEEQEEAAWGEHGCDKVIFEVSTNPGSPAGPLNRIASGGELSRFMLALKAVLASSDKIPTIIFDEVDAGIGGAVAAAVGERLSTLSEGAQVLVVTHSPQVASRGAYHWRVSKSGDAGQVRTAIETLTSDARKEELARMLAGAEVTEEARAAADSLLQGVGR
ncbi:MAG: DNA repair protein RecN [Rhodospirillaceae bacterium]|nr:DNA repair protein RecN [Rhodospirillaceae bacterium]MBL6930252.1 DNA repair protein RecN [Rhodospirillales bacterium]